MKSEYIAVEDCELELSDGVGNIEITSEPSKKIKIDGNGIYFDSLKFTISTFNGGSIANADGYYEGEIKATSKNVKTEGKAVVRENDESEEFIIYGTYSTPTGPATGTDSITVKIKNAGQKKIRVM